MFLVQEMRNYWHYSEICCNQFGEVFFQIEWLGKNQVAMPLNQKLDVTYNAYLTLHSKYMCIKEAFMKSDIANIRSRFV